MGCWAANQRTLCVERKSAVNDFGGHVLAQRMSAVYYTASKGFTAHSVHCYFIRGERRSPSGALFVDAVANAEDVDIFRRETRLGAKNLHFLVLVVVPARAFTAIGRAFVERRRQVRAFVATGALEAELRRAVVVPGGREVLAFDPEEAVEDAVEADVVGTCLGFEEHDWERGRERSLAG
ncbi:hypothetical protein GCK72_022507 [Caenorhabditis remanei]|uniref:Uncharacterized protein n=1 Tax=Caenorhabditis remanei TaxID=31234 RepID=A0A6A5FU75_CAERE|nr:hypothetical protein GCK72_022507 [Caenorhabditis remanei]KAF1746056.1 hypothetical protein GCK72_022507 [Caenorhabditis remanei]